MYDVDRLLEEGLDRVNAIRFQRNMEPLEDWRPAVRGSWEVCLLGQAFDHDADLARNTAKADGLLGACESAFECGELPSHYYMLEG